MKIATWNICSGISINDYKGEFFDKEKSANIDDVCLNEIAKLIKENEIDVIALQEVITTPSFEYLNKLSSLSGLKYFKMFENSPCHLVENSNFGIAILSKYPLEIVKKEFFKNPNLTKQTAKGLYKTHDKGFLCVKVCSTDPFNFLTLHMLPFHRFDSHALEFKEYFENFQDFVQENNVVACGDFNVVEGKEKLVQLLDRLSESHNFTFDEITTFDNKKCANMLIPKTITFSGKQIIKSEETSDHFLCVMNIDI